jgi:O-antigen/teichoic acid export membrane protein
MTARRVFHAVNAIFCGHTLVRLGSLVLVPLFLRYWPAARYGEYVALFAATGYLTGLDVGMQQATINRLTQAYARADLEEYRSIQHTAMAFYLALAAIVTVLVAGLVWLLPIPGWIGLRLTAPATATMVIILLSMQVLWAMPMRFIAATYQTTGNLARSQWIANFQQAMVTVFSAAALILGGSMIAIAGVQILTVILTALFVLMDIRRRLPELFPGISGANFRFLKELANPSLLFALLLAGNLIAYQGSILLTAGVMGGLAVAVLSISKTMIDVIRQSLYSISLALTPDFARMEALGEFSKLRRVHRITVVGTAIVTLACVASLWYEGAGIIAFWTRGRIVPDEELLRLFLVLLAFQTPWAASSTVATATNQHRVQAFGYFFAAVAGTALVAALLRPLGTWAVPVGLILGEAIFCYHFVVRASCRIIGEHYGAFACRFWLGFAGIGAAVLSSGWVLHHMMPGPMLLRCAAMGLVTLTVAAAGGWLFWLKPEDREALWPPVLQPIALFRGRPSS